MDLDELRHAARSRDPAAWEALGRGLSEELHRFFSNCFDKLSTEDLVQVTALIVMRKFDEFEPDGPHSFRNWVHAIAGRQAREWMHEPLREAARRGKLSSRPSPTPMTSPSSQVLRQEQLGIIADCLPRLPAAHRRALESGLAGDDYENLAEREGITVTGARVRRHRALLGLRKIVEAARSTPSAGPVKNRKKPETRSPGHSY